MPLLTLALDGLGILLPRLSEWCRGLSAAGCLETTGESSSLWVRGCIGLRGVISGSPATEADVVLRRGAMSAGTFVCRAGSSCLLRRRGMLSLGDASSLLQFFGTCSSLRLGEYVSDFGISTKRRSGLSSSFAHLAVAWILAASSSEISASSMMGYWSSTPRSGGSSNVADEAESDSLASETASSSTVGGGGCRRWGFRLRLRPRGRAWSSIARRKAGALEDGSAAAGGGGGGVELWKERKVSLRAAYGREDGERGLTWRGYGLWQS